MNKSKTFCSNYENFGLFENFFTKKSVYMI